VDGLVEEDDAELVEEDDEVDVEEELDDILLQDHQ